MLAAVQATRADTVITTFAGNPIPTGTATNIGQAANGLVVDSSGNIYVADASNHAIRKINPTNGISTVIAGTGRSGFSGDGGAATSAQLNSPRGVALDASGNLYIADTSNHRIRRIDTNGTITTFVGNGTGTFGGDNADATAARVNSPQGVAVDSSGNVYIADTSNNRVRKVTLGPTNIITTVAGNGTGGYLADNVAATSTRINSPRGVVVDSSGNLYIADTSNNRIRMVSTNGTITTFAGTGTASFSGDGGAATSAAIRAPQAVTLDSSGNLYFADTTNHRIRKVTLGPTNIITTLSGTGAAGFSGDGAAATSAQVSSPAGIAVDSSGNVYVGDTGNARVRMIGADSNISTVAGTGSTSYGGDGGAATSAQFSTPQGVAVDSAGNIYQSDSGQHRIRKIDTSGNISTYAGTGTAGFSGDGGHAAGAQLNTPLGIAIDASDNLYIADGNNNRIRKVDSSGTITTFAGTGTGSYGGDGGAATNAQLFGVFGVGVDGSGNVYIGDTGNNRIRKVDTNGTITTFAGTGSSGLSGDGGSATNAQIYTPMQVGSDSSGNIYFVDYNNSRIRKVATDGTITTYAGTSAGNSGDNGAAAGAQLNAPRSLAVDASGNVYIADTSNHRVRKVDTNGIITTFAGTTSGFSGDGGDPASAQLSSPQGVAVGNSGEVYVADTSNKRIRRIGVPITYTLAYDGNGSTGGTAPTDPSSPYNAGSTVTLLGNTGGLVKTGSTFSGWNTAADGSGTSHSESGTFTIASNTTLYAQWAVNPVPSAPTGFSATASGSTISLVWTNPTEVSFASCTIRRSTSGYPTSITDGTAVASGLTGTSHDDAGLADGTYYYSIFALNSGGDPSSSATATATTDTAGPIVSSVGVPSDATYLGGQNLDFTVSFNEAVTVDTGGGIPSIALIVGATSRYASYIAGSGSAALTFRYTVQSGDNDNDGIVVGALLSNSGTLRDAAGNDAILTLNGVGSTAGVLVDALAPAVVSIVRQTPTAQTIRTNQVVFEVTFSEPVSGVVVTNFFVSKLNSATVSTTVSALSGGPTVYDVTVDVGAGAGEFRLDLGPMRSTFATGVGQPKSLVFDTNGHLYVADGGNNSIRKVTADGTVTTLASGINNINGIAISAAGDLYATAGSDVKKVTTAGAVSTFATGFNVAGGLAFDTNGNLFVGNYGNSTISKVTTNGMVSTYASSVSSPFGLVFDRNGLLYVAHRDLNTISTVSAAGVLTQFATGFNGPHQMEFDAAGNLYVADRWYPRIAKVSTNGTVTTYAGALGAPFGLAFSSGGDLFYSDYLVGNTLGRLTPPVITDASTNLLVELPYEGGESYISDPNDAPTALALSTNVFSAPQAAGATLATLTSTDADGADTHTYAFVSGTGDTDNASFSIVGNELRVGGTDLAADQYSVRIASSDGQGGSFTNSFILRVVDDVVPEIASITRKIPASQAARTNQVVYEVTFTEPVAGVAAGRFTVVPVNGSDIVASVTAVSGGPTVYEVTVDIASGTGDFRLDVAAPAGPVLYATTYGDPWGLAFTTNGDLYVSHYLSNTVSRVTTNGTVSIMATGLNRPTGLAVDATNMLYASYAGQSRVYKIATNGTKTSFATSTTAAQGLAFAPDRRLYVAGTNALFRVETNGSRSTVVSGLASARGVAYGPDGLLYVASFTGNSVFRVATNGTITPFLSGLNAPVGLVFDASGNLYVANSGDNTVLRVAANGVSSTLASGFSTPYGLAINGEGDLYVANYASNTVSRVSLDLMADLAGNPVDALPYTSADIFTYVPNAAPTDMELSSASVGFSEGAGTLVGTLSTTDTDVGDTHTYTLVGGTGDTDNASFAIDGDALKVGASILEVGEYSVRVQTDDGNGGTYAEAFTITVVDDVAPEIVSIVRRMPLAQVMRTNSVFFAVTFSEAVVGVNESWFVVAPANGGSTTGSVAAVTGGPVVYEVAVNVESGAGDFRLEVRPPSSPLLTTFATGLIWPVGIAFDDDGNLFVANNSGTTLGRVTSEGVVSTVATNLPSTPFDVVAGTGGDLFVTAGSSLVKVTSGGAVSVVASNLFGATSVAMDAAGDLYVGFNPGPIMRVTQAGATNIFVTNSFSSYGSAFDGDGNYYTTDLDTHSVYKVTSGGAVSLVSSDFGFPIELAFDNSGLLHVSDYSAGTVKTVDTNGVASVLATGFNGTTGLAFDSQGHLYVANRSGNSVSRLATGSIQDLAGVAISGLPYTSGEIYTYDPNDAPTDLALSSASVNESESADATVGTLSTTDADGSDIHTYSLVSGAGDTNNASFTIETNALKVGASALAAGSYSVRIQTDDGNFGSYAEAFTITVVDDVAPQIVSIVRQTPSAQVMRTNLVVFRVTFSEAVKGLDAGRFTVAAINGGTVAGSVASITTNSPTEYDVAVSLTGGAGDFRLETSAAGIESATFGSGYNGPVALAFDTTGNLYVANNGGSTVGKIAPDGSVITNVFGSGYVFPTALAFDSSGYLYVASYSGSTVKKVAPDGTVVSANFGSGYSGPSGLAFDAAGNLYVANQNTHRVSKVAPDGSVITNAFGSGYAMPCGLAFDADGFLYVANGGNTVSKIAPDGSAATNNFGSGYNQPFGLAFGPDGNLYVANRGDNRLTQVAPDGSVITNNYGSGYDYPAGVAFDAGGNLYVANLVGNSVFKIRNAVIQDLGGNDISNTPYSSGEAYTYDPNDAPMDLLLSNASINESSSANWVVGTLSATDADGGDTHAYTLVSGAGDTDNASFVIETNTLKVGASALAAGSYTVRVQTDDGNGGTYAEAFTITVVDDVAPSITGVTAPAAGGYRAGDVLEFTITFDEAVAVTGTPRIGLVVGSASCAADHVSGDNSPTLVFRYTVQSGDTDSDGIVSASPIDLNGGAIQDAAGNDAALAFTAPDTTGVLVDTTVPEILAIVRKDPAARVFRTNTVVFEVTFSEAVSGVDTSWFTVTPTNGGTTVASVASVTGGPAVYDVAVDVIGGAGDFRLDLVALERTVQPFASGFNGPVNLAFDAAGFLYVVNGDGNSVSRVDTNGTVTVFATGFSAPNGLVLDAEGNLYVANWGNHSVSKVTTSGVVSTFATGLNRPVGLVFDGEGNLFVSSIGDDAIRKVATNGVVSVFATGFDHPRGMVFDAEGNLYVANYFGGSILKVTTGGVVTTHLSGLNYPSDLRFGSDGGLYVVETGGGQVSRVDTNGVASLFVSGISTPFGMAFDAAGVAFVGSYIDNTVSRVAPGRLDDPSGNAVSGLPYTSGEAYTYDPNDAPTGLALSNTSIGLSSGSDAMVGTLTTTDADGSDTHSYTLVSGTGDADNASFTIETNVLKVGASDLAAGSYSVRIQTDDGNGGTYAEAFSITVTDDVGPTVVSVSAPTNGIYRASEFLDFTVSFTEPVTVLGVPALELTVGSTARTATFHSGGGTTNLVFRHTVQAGDEDTDGVSVGALTLAGGTIRDAAANDAVLTLNNVASTTGVLVDGVAPVVTSVKRKTPSQQVVDTATLVFEVTFSEDVANVDASAFTVRAVNGGTITANVTGVSGGPRIYDVTVQITGGLGEFRLEVGTP